MIDDNNNSRSLFRECRQFIESRKFRIFLSNFLLKFIFSIINCYSKHNRFGVCLCMYLIGMERSILGPLGLFLSMLLAYLAKKMADIFTGVARPVGERNWRRDTVVRGGFKEGLLTVPGFGWWLIKAYHPCPGFVASGGRYRRRSQSMDKVDFGRGGKGSPVGTSDEAETR